MLKFRYFLIDKGNGKGNAGFSVATKRTIRDTIRRLGFDYASESRDAYGNRVFKGLGPRAGFVLTYLEG